MWLLGCGVLWVRDFWVWGFVVCCVCWFVDGALGMPRLFLFDCLFNIML